MRMATTAGSACLWLLIGNGAGVQAAQAGLIPTEAECLDGNQQDVDGTADLSVLSHPELKRLFAAQGRRMALYIASTRDRQHTGEPTGYETPLLAVELEEAKDLLFVLTGETNTGEPDPLNPGEELTIPGKLIPYDVSSPQTPQERPAITTIQGEPIRASDIRLIPEDDKLLVLHKVVAFRKHRPVRRRRAAAVLGFV